MTKRNQHQIFRICFNIINIFFAQVDPKRKSNLRLEVEGDLVEVLLETRLVTSDDQSDFVMDPKIINGLKSYKTAVKERFPIEKSSMARLSSASTSQKTIIEFPDLRPGSAIAFMFALHPDQVI
jgi:hypothetical protein